MKLKTGTAKPQIVVLAGATAAGKSSLAIKLAQIPKMPSIEIICADSRQIYRGMDIGTDKISIKEQNGVPHHLLDIIDPDTRFSAADFVAAASECIENISTRKAVPLVVGGTGLYIRALTCGLAQLSAPVIHIRKKYELFLKENGPEALYSLLWERDECRAKKLSPSDTFRIIRALEITDTGTVNISQTLKSHSFELRPFDSLKIFLNVDRKKLYIRINTRVDTMIDKGLIEEVNRLRQKFGANAPALSGIGYRQIARYLDGELTQQEAISIIKRDTRHYAKRQITWFQKEPDIVMLNHDPDKPEASLKKLEEKIRRFHGY